MTPAEMVSRLLYRDGLMLVIDKPAGFAVHRGPNGGESLEDHFDALRFGLPRSPALAHRLDRDTSGCLVLGRHRKALAQLGKLFKNGDIGKTYWAMVEGSPETAEGVIELPLGRRDVTRGWWMKPDPEGQPAATKWNVMGRYSPTSPWRGELAGRSAQREGGQEGVNGLAASPHPDAALTRVVDPPPAGEGRILTWLALEPLDRAHASAARALRGNGLADLGRCDLRLGAADRRPDPASAFARGRGAALQEPLADPRHRAAAAAHARRAGAMRVASGQRESSNDA